MSKIHRFAFVTDSVEIGAITYSNIKLAERLIDEGHEVDFVGFRRADDDARALLPAKAYCVALGMQRVRQGALRLANYARERRPDAILASCHMECLLTSLAARLLPYEPRLILRLHNATEPLLAAQRTIFDRRLLAPALRLVPPKRSRFVAVSSQAARDFEHSTGYAPGTIGTLYDPVLPPAHRGFDAFDHPWLHEPQVPFFLGVGRMEPQKNFALLIRAFSIAKRTKPNIRLMILGDGSERPMLEALAQNLGVANSVSMPGFADPSRAYQNAAAFVLSSDWEGLCNVIIEALAAGCPVVSTDCPAGPAEVLENGRHGQLVPVGDAEALAESILRAPSLPFDRKAALNRAMDFHIDNVWPAFADLAGLSAQASNNSE